MVVRRALEDAGRNSDEAGRSGVRRGNARGA